MDNAVLMIAKQAPQKKGKWRVMNITDDEVKAVKKEIERGRLLMPTWVIAEKPKKTRKFLFSSYEKIEAAGGLVKHKDKFLFIRRHNRWDIPKGKLEKNEHPIIAAVREIEEECGIKSSFPNKTSICTWHTYSQDKKLMLKKTYWFTHDLIGSPKTKVQKEEHITKAEWLTRSEIKKAMNDTYDSIIDVVKADKRI